MKQFLRHVAAIILALGWLLFAVFALPALSALELLEKLDETLDD